MLYEVKFMCDFVEVLKMLGTGRVKEPGRLSDGASI